MTEIAWRPTKTFMIAGTLVVAGFLLTAVSGWFMLLVAAGTFGPGILREFGVLRDKDEFETVAMYRAGYHAFLVSGVVAFALIAFTRSSWDAEAGASALRGPDALGTLFAAVLWCSWMFSTLFSIWGAIRASRRILLAFGLVWLLFNVLSNTGPEWTGPSALFMQSLLAAPFLVVAWACGRWPRASGAALLIAAALLLFWFNGLDPKNLRNVNALGTYVLFIGPLLASGIALITAPRASEE